MSRIILLPDVRYALPLPPGLDERGRAKILSFKSAPLPQDSMLMGIRWYVAYPLGYHHSEELMEERGVAVDHATIQRGVVQDSPLLEAVFHRWKRSVWARWRMDETSIKVRLLLDSRVVCDE